MDPLARVPVAAETRAPDGRTAAHVVGREDAVLVDPADSTPELDRECDRRGLAHVVVTHAHPDHVGGVAAYADRATVHALAGHADRFRAAAGVEPDRTFRDGDRVGGLEVVATPGHAPDHVAFAVETGGTDGGTGDPGRGSGGSDRGSGDADRGSGDADGGGDDGIGRESALLVGDLAVAEGSVVVGAPEGDVAAYLDSLRRIRDRDPDRLYPAHGPVIEDPAATLSRLIDHRLDRERRVRRAVEDGARDPDAVVEAAYEKDLTGVYDLARATVVAHLEKLADEGTIEFDGERARPA